MKFSYNLIKKLAPGKYDQKKLADKLNLMSFETVYLGGDTLEIGVAPNRFSDAASHLGIAREVSVIFGCQLNDPTLKAVQANPQNKKTPSIKIQDKNLCRRYMGAYVAGVKVGPSPKWLKEVLEVCGLRSINNVVDIMNYAMLETGQPLHAFDADKLKGGIVVRRARKGEKIETIPDRTSDNQKFILDKETLVIADAKQALAIAGIKGGKFTEITKKTKNILVEAANFGGIGIYKSAKRLGLRTDASIRFSHNLSPALVEMGMNRALILLQELAVGKIGKSADVYPKKQSKKLLKLDVAKISKLIGYQFKESKLQELFQKLGFVREKNFWQVPAVRADINDLEDLAEEAARFMDYNRLPIQPPVVGIGVAIEEELILLKDKIRNFLSGAGFSEVYNYSFLSEKEISNGAIPLVNPISNQFTYLRDSLAAGLSRNLNDNLRFFEEVRIFEIGKMFSKNKNDVQENLILGIGIVSKNGILEVKGLVDTLFERLGLADYFLPNLNVNSKFLKPAESLRIETGDHQVIGYLGSLSGIKGGALAEINLEELLKTVSGEREFEPLSKYPSVARDLSILVPKSVRVGEVLAFLQNASPKLIQDVDLIDFYEDSKLGADRKSLTFRIIFQVNDRTLTDREVDKETAIINQALTEKFDAELR